MSEYDNPFAGTEDLTAAVLVDGINTYYGFKSLRWSPDYKKMLGYFKKKTILKKMYYFASLDRDREENSIVRLVDWLDFNGYIAKVTDSDERNRDISVDFTIQALKLVSIVDHYILLSGNGAFTPLVKHLDNIGKMVTICSTMLNEKMVSDDLRRAADNFVELDTLRKYIEKEPYERQVAA